MTARRPSLRIHVEITVLTCPLHCIAGAADEQAPRGVVPKVAGSRIDQSGKALLRHRGAVTGPVTHEPSKNTPVVPSTMIPCNDLIASSPTKHTTHTHMLINTLVGGMVLGDMLRCSCCHHANSTLMRLLASGCRVRPALPQSRRRAGDGGGPELAGVAPCKPSEGWREPASAANQLGHACPEMATRVATLQGPLAAAGAPEAETRRHEEATSSRRDDPAAVRAQGRYDAHQPSRGRSKLHGGGEGIFAGTYPNDRAHITEAAPYRAEAPLRAVSVAVPCADGGRGRAALAARCGSKAGGALGATQRGVAGRSAALGHEPTAPPKPRSGFTLTERGQEP